MILCPITQYADSQYHPTLQVGDRILAMARPWQEYVHKFSLVDAFVKNNIGMILNLQEVCVVGVLVLQGGGCAGEHASMTGLPG